ncbi:MAG TPA: peptidylprolyl isomerase [Bryobacteraceae bacterium]|jgi:parvulin-like peptidyl-prolyl isomerase
MKYLFKLSLLLGLAIAPVFAQVTVLDEIVCKVNGEIITRSELEKSRRELEAHLRQNGLRGDKLDAELKKRLADLLRDRIDSILLVQKAKELDIKVDNELNKEIANIQRQSKIADQDKFQAYIREGSGMSYEDFRGEEKNQLLRDAVISQEVSRKITFKREELEAYYNAHQDEFHREERVSLSEIFISSAGMDAAGQAAAEKKARDLVARANKGENFGELAKANSDNAATAQDGGALAPYVKGDMPPALEAAVWDKARGFVTDPIRRTDPPEGWEILRVNDHQKAGLASFEEVQHEVENKLYQPRFEPAIRAYLTKLRVTAFLEIKSDLGYTDSGAAPNKDTAWVNPADLKPETIKKEEILAQNHRKHIFGLIPIPGTSTANTGTSSSK